MKGIEINFLSKQQKELLKKFSEECYIINFTTQYPRTGIDDDIYLASENNIKWMISSPYSEAVFKEKYAEILSVLQPFEYIDINIAITIKECNKELYDYDNHISRNVDYYAYEDGTTEAAKGKSLQTGYWEDKEEADRQVWRKIFLARGFELIKLMPAKQRERLYKNKVEGKSIRQIGDEEGINYSAVAKSIRAAEKFLLDNTDYLFCFSTNDFDF